MLEFREIKNDAEYNSFSIAENAPFTQGLIYGQWQEMIGRKVRRFEIIWKTENIGFFQVIKYPLPFSQSFLYIPHGPVLKVASYLDDEFLKKFCDKLSEIAKEENAVFVRFDPVEDLNKTVAIGDRLNAEGNSSASTGFDFYFHKVPPYAYHSSYFQPKFEWILDLQKTEEELLNEMHPKARYSIGLAGKRGVKIEIADKNFEDYFNDFYKLLEETARRNNFNLHPKNYYQNIFSALGGSALGGETYEKNRYAFLIIAKYSDKILLINLVLLYGKTAYFLFGGSSGEHKNLMFSHLAQWETIKEAKKRGMAVYNFGGVGPSTSLRVNNNDQFEGISRFKKRFGGEIFEHSDSYDIVLKPFWYYLYNLRKWFLSLPLRGISRREKK